MGGVGRRREGGRMDEMAPEVGISQMERRRKEQKNDGLNN
jgi:hypothetical protein